MKVVIAKKSYVFVLVLMIIVGSLLAIRFDNTGTFAQVYFGNNPKLYPIYRVDTDEKKVAITFDAAWGADKTEQIMDVLDEYNVKATFFLVGFWMEKYPEMTKLIYERGFEVGSHSYNHPDMTKLDCTQINQELSSTNDKIKELTGQAPTLFRPPYGAYDNKLIEELDKLNMTGIQWDVDTLDWKGYTPSQVIQRVNNGVQCGSIILCHNNADHVVENTRLILTTLLNKGYSFVKVSELVKDVKEVKIGVGYTK